MRSRAFSRLASGLTLVSLGFLAACASARMVEVESGKGGVVAIDSSGNQKSREKAKLLMAEGCPGKRAVIVKEGEVVVGSRTESSADTTQGERKSTNLFTGKSSTKPTSNTQTSTTTSQVKEWRISYRCK